MDKKLSNFEKFARIRNNYLDKLPWDKRTVFPEAQVYCYYMTWPGFEVVLKVSMVSSGNLIAKVSAVNGKEVIFSGANIIIKNEDWLLMSIKFRNKLSGDIEKGCALVESILEKGKKEEV